MCSCRLAAYEAAQYAAIAADFIDRFAKATNAPTASTEYAAIDDLIVATDALKADFAKRRSALTQKAKDETVIEMMKQQLGRI